MTKLVLRFREVDRDKFNDIINGKKTIETRAATTKYQKVKEGDQLIIICGKDKCVKEVKKVEHYASIEIMLEHLDLNKILPTAKSLEEAKQIYYSFPGYKEEIERNGIQVFYL